MQGQDNAILFFDGVCDLCNGFVQFFIKRDKKKKFLFASLQSPAGKKALNDIYEMTGQKPDSIIMFYKDKYFTESGAVLRALSMLGGLWKTSHVLVLIPRFVRDALYNWIARNRYRWFGKRDECMIPTQELQSRFLQ